MSRDIDISIADPWNFEYSRKNSVIYQRIIQLEYYHFVAPNEIMDLDSDSQ